jgi:hypothetical protein
MVIESAVPGVELVTWKACAVPARFGSVVGCTVCEPNKNVLAGSAAVGVATCVSPFAATAKQTPAIGAKHAKASMRKRILRIGPFLGVRRWGVRTTHHGH